MSQEHADREDFIPEIGRLCIENPAVVKSQSEIQKATSLELHKSIITAAYVDVLNEYNKNPPSL